MKTHTTIIEDKCPRCKGSVCITIEVPLSAREQELEGFIRDLMPYLEEDVCFAVPRYQQAILAARRAVISPCGCWRVGAVECATAQKWMDNTDKSPVTPCGCACHGKEQKP